MNTEIKEEGIEIRTPDGIADGLLFEPGGEAKGRAGVLFLTDIKGIRPEQTGMAKRIAAEGYVVLMPNIFYRTAKPPVMAKVPDGSEEYKKRLGELSGPLTAEAVESDVANYLKFLESRNGEGNRKVGVVGYCVSGAIAMRAAALQPDQVVAVASFHGGRLYTDSPASPHLRLPRIKARLYFGHAEGDNSMPAEAIEKFDRALAQWGGKYKSEVYEGAHHGWTVPGGQAYNEPQAERAWSELKNLFAEILQAAVGDASFAVA